MNPIDPLRFEKEHLLQLNRRLKRIIIGLAILLLAFIGIYIYNHLYADRYNFIGRNDDATANPNMHNYRRGIHLNKRSMGVYYPADSIRKFLDSTFPALIATQKAYEVNHPSNLNYARYKWMIGFYWMMKKDSSTAGKANKLDFYVIPTLVDSTNPLGVIDYYTDTDSVYFHGTDVGQKKGSGSPLTTSGDGNAFDEGQLWP